MSVISLYYRYTHFKDTLKTICIVLLRVMLNEMSIFCFYISFYNHHQIIFTFKFLSFYHQHLEKCLPYSICLINICWIFISEIFKWKLFSNTNLTALPPPNLLWETSLSTWWEMISVLKTYFSLVIAPVSFSIHLHEVDDSQHSGKYVIHSSSRDTFPAV